MEKDGLGGRWVKGCNSDHVPVLICDYSEDLLLVSVSWYACWQKECTTSWLALRMAACRNVIFWVYCLMSVDRV